MQKSELQTVRDAMKKLRFQDAKMDQLVQPAVRIPPWKRTASQ